MLGKTSPVVKKLHGKKNANCMALAAFEPCLRELSCVWGDVQGESDLVFDKMYRTFCAPMFSRTYRGIYGLLAPFRGIRQKLKNRVRQYLQKSERETYHVSFIVPSDAVVFAPESADRLVVVSRSSGKMLKLFRYEKSDAGKLHPEIEGLDYLGKNNLSGHAPVIYDKGTSSDGIDWMLAEFAPNTSPPNLFYATRFFHRRWQTWKAAQVVPYLLKLYKTSQTANIPRDQVLEKYERALNTIDIIFRKKLPDVRRAELPDQLLVAQIYGDVMAAHIHRSSKTKWTLIDWGKTRRGPIVRDLLADYFGLPEGRGWLQSSFASWMRGEMPPEQLPREVQTDLKVLAGVYAELAGDEPGYQELKGLIRLTAIYEAARLIENGENTAGTNMIVYWFPQ